MSVKKICKLANQVIFERYLLSSGLWHSCCSCPLLPVTRFVAASQMFPVVEEGWDCGWGCAGGRMMGCMATGGGMSCEVVGGVASGIVPGASTAGGIAS